VAVTTTVPGDAGSVKDTVQFPLEGEQFAGLKNPPGAEKVIVPDKLVTVPASVSDAVALQFMIEPAGAEVGEHETDTETIRFVAVKDVPPELPM
jgi:hypothetical protein